MVIGEVVGKMVIIVDDIVDIGLWIVNFVIFFKKCGVDWVFGVVIYVVLFGDVS